MSMAWRVQHTANCAAASVQPALIGGVLFTGFHAAQGMPLTPMLAASNVGFIFAYGALQCPMEALHGRRSLAHNFLSGATLGYVGVASGSIGVPFNLEYPLLVRRIPLPVGGALVYGGLAALLAGFQGKKL